jgi:hypothetical protein
VRHRSAVGNRMNTNPLLVSRDEGGSG